jgi:hypothetical protein
MCKFLVLSFLLHIASALADESPELHNLLKRASQKDKAAFATDYLHAAFSHWQDRFRLETFTVDSVFAKGEYDEIWLYQANSNHRLALLVSRQPQRRIVEVRRLLLTERQRLQPVDNEIVEFVERLYWAYEIGVESFMQDFLFPGHIKLRYEGVSDQEAALSRLRTKFKTMLPIQSMNWEGRNYNYIIRLVMDSPLQPLEIAVDIQKHLTGNFFELADKTDRVRALKDSLRLWTLRQPAKEEKRDLLVSAATASEALRKILAQNFKGYDLAIFDSAAMSMSIEAILPAMEQIRPGRLRFHLEATAAGAGQYAVRAKWLNSSAKEMGLAPSPFTLKNIFGNFSNTGLRAEIANAAIRGYGTLSLPAAFQPDFAGAEMQLVLHHLPGDSFTWRNPQVFQNILRTLARGKPAYFFLEDVTPQANTFLLTGYAFWRDSQRLWQHVAKIRETHSVAGAKAERRQIRIDLYPYIRLENVRALFATSDTSARREKIVIKR